jgi:predicted nicotinamide N-methyase
MRASARFVGHAHGVEITAERALDRLRLMPVSLVPQIHLHLAEDAIVWWARMEAEAGRKLAMPFWASAWLGGQAVARYIVDHPATVAGLRVLDLASGCGVVAIAAALTGAASVAANDVDPAAITAITVNAQSNGVEVTTVLADLLDDDVKDVDVVLAGDVLYGQPTANRMLSFLRRAAGNGSRVIIGDPQRGYVPPDLTVLASYESHGAAVFSDSELARVDVMELLPERARCY